MPRRYCGSCRGDLHADDGHSECVPCLGKSHADAALAGSDCSHCKSISLASLRTRIAFFSESDPAPRALPFSSSQGPVRKKQRGRGFQRLVESELTPAQIPRASFSPHREISPVLFVQPDQRPSASVSDLVSFGGSDDELADDSMSLVASDAEELWGSVTDPAPSGLPAPSAAKARMELFRVLSKAVEELGLEWSPPEEPSRSRLDEWFLPGRRQAPQQWPLPFFPEVHDELTRSWRSPYSARLRTSASSALTTVDGAEEKGYERMPQLDESVAAHLCPPTAIGWKAKASHPSKPCRTTSALAGRSYASAGQAASALHSMAVLQVYQAKLLSAVDESEPDPATLRELRSATDLALRATKTTAQAIGRSMASLVVLERDLWLTLTEIKDADRVSFLDAPISPSGLFGPAVKGFAERFTEAQKASQAMRHFLPKRSSPAAAQSRERSRSALRGDDAAGKRSHRNGFSSFERVRLLQPLLPRPQKGWRPPAHPRSQTPESRPHETAVQDDHTEADPLADLHRGLVLFSGPERRILSHPDSPPSQTILEIRLRGSGLPVHGPTLWAVSGPPYFYEVHGCGSFPSETDGNPHSQLPRRLAHSGPVRGGTTFTQNPHPQPLRAPGAQGQFRQKRTVSQPTNIVPGYSSGLSSHESGDSARTRSGHSETRGHLQERHRSPTQSVSENAGPYGRSIASVTAGPAPHAPPSTLVETTGSTQRMASRTLAYQGESGLCNSPDPLEEPTVDGEGRGHGVGPHQESCHDRRLQHRLGALCEGKPTFGHWSKTESGFHINCLEMLAVCRACQFFLPDLIGRHVLIRSDNMSVVSYINHQGGVSSKRLFILAERLLEWAQLNLRSLRAAHLPGRLNQGADMLSRSNVPSEEWMLHPQVVQKIWKTFGKAEVDLFASKDNSHCPTYYSKDRDALAHDWPNLLLYACPASTGRQAYQGTGSQGAIGGPLVEEPTLVVRADSATDSSPLARAPETGSPLSGERNNMAPSTRAVGSLHLAAQWEPTGLPERVLNTISEARAPSTRRLYALKWSVFSTWCLNRGENPSTSELAVVLSFLQELLDKGRSHSTLKVFVAAIAAFHAPIAGQSVGRDNSVVRFLKGARRLNPPRPLTVPTWDLPTVLRALKGPPFEPLQSTDLRSLSLKTALLLALASVKRVGDLQALSTSPACLEFGPNDSKVVLKPRHGYVPKVLSTPFRAQVITLSALPPSEEDRELSLLCPVRALRIYFERSAPFRHTEQLFVSFGNRTKGHPITKQRLSKWIVDAVMLAYSSLGLQCPIGVRAHSTRGIASSWAWSSGVSITEICTAAGWATPSTFARFYNLDIPALQARVLSA